MLVEALRVQALTALRQRCWGAAERAVDEGLAVARDSGFPYAEARLLHVSGLLCVQTGPPGAARERLQASLVIFQRLGACGDATRVEQALR